MRSFYGWTAIAGASLVYFAGCGTIYYSFGVFLSPMCEDLGASRASVSGAYSLMILLLGLVGPISGRVITRVGPRKGIILGNLLAAGGLALMGSVDSVWQVYFFFGTLIGVGVSFGMLLPSTTVAINWFREKRSLALSLVMAAGGVGGMVMPPIVGLLIVDTGWPSAWLALAGIHLLLAVLVGGILLVRNSPESMGRLPDRGMTVREGVDSGLKASSLRLPSSSDSGMVAVLRNKKFWVLTVMAAAHMFALNAVMTHQVAYLQDVGFAPVEASTTLGVLSGASVLGRLVFGPLAMRVNAKWLTIIFMSGMVAALLILIWARVLPLAFTYSVVFGLCHGAVMVARYDLTSDVLGKTRYAEVAGWQALVASVVGASSAPIAGAIYDATQSYVAAFVMVALVIVAGMVSMFGFGLTPAGEVDTERHD